MVELHTLAIGDWALGKEEELHSWRGLVLEEEGDTPEVEVLMEGEWEERHN